MKKILLVGATGFTGQHVLPLLIERYGSVSCFVRSSSQLSLIERAGVEIIEGNLDDDATLEAALHGKDILVFASHLVRRISDGGKGSEGLVRACRAAGVHRAVLLSSTSIYTAVMAPAKAARLAAEKAITDSELDYTIIRPTMIYGTPRDRNMIRLIQYLQRYPVIFVPGDGNSRQQPIHVGDVARALVDCLEVKATSRNAYDISGADPLTFNEVIDQTCDALRVKRLKLHLPLKPALIAASILNGLRRKPWIKDEQILRLNEDKSVDHGAARRDFNFSPRSFNEGIRHEVAFRSMD